MYYSLVTLLCFWSLNSVAHWPDRVAQELKAQEAQAAHLKNPAVATFWGGIRRYLHWPSNQGSEQALSSKLFHSGKFPLYFSQAARPEAPLFVFMPGIYGKIKDGLTPLTIEYLESLGGHVLVVPNLLAPIYIEAGPRYQQDPVALEVQVMEEALSYALTQLPSVRRVHVVAESLGTAVGAAWVSWDREHKKRLTDFTLLWPPLDLYWAMKNFDTMINAHRDFDCSTVTKLWTVSTQFLLNTFPGPLTTHEQNCAGQMVLVDGFLKATKKAWVSWRTLQKKEAPDAEAPQSFEAFFRQYHPAVWNMLERRDERLKLAYWMKKIRRDPNFKVRILTSQDDFLNFHLDWSEFRSQFFFTDQELIILSWGGHSGPIGLPQFPEYLKAVFSEEGETAYKNH